MSRSTRTSWLAKIPWQSARRTWYWPPNILSSLRILASWIPAYLLVAGFHDASQRWWAAGIFLFIALSDGLDGFIARRFNLRSEWGMFIDPIADKLLVTITAVTLCVVYVQHPFGWVLIVATALFVTRELVLAVRIARVQTGIVVPTWTGKLKTVVQMAMLTAWLTPLERSELGATILAAVTNIALVLTVVSWIDYHERYVAVPSRRD